MAIKQVSFRERLAKPLARFWDSNKNRSERQFPENFIPAEALLSIRGNEIAQAQKNELEWLRKKDTGLAKVYEDALKNFYSQVKPIEFERRWSLNILLDLAQRIPREAVCSHLGISTKRVSEGIANKFGREELAKRKEFFDMVAFGDVKNHVIAMAGAPKQAHIEFERVYAEIWVYRACVYENGSQEGQKKYVYLKEAGGEPDMLAKELLDDASVTAPKSINARYTLPDGTVSEYCLMQDIADAKDVDKAVSLRGLARDAEMSAFVLSNLDEFWRKLGYAFEACRMLGIQDRHNRNVFVVRKKDGSLSIGMIDLDIVACYSPSQSYIEAYAGQFHWISASIDFAQEFGESVRTAPLQIKDVLALDLAEQTRARMMKITERGFEKFLQGAADANSYYMLSSTQKRIRKIMMKYDGKPVGWGCSERKIMDLAKKRDRAVAIVNGNIQRIMSKGPNRGRFMLAGADAWEHGFKPQLDAKSDGFWNQMVGYWKQKLQDWVPASSGTQGKVVTIAY